MLTVDSVQRGRPGGRRPWRPLRCRQTARDQFAALLPIVERVKGPEHPHTLAARAGLAYWTREAEGGGN
jgi:hypothetical protein